MRLDGGTAANNRITQNSIYSNGGKGIENLNGGNHDFSGPAIYSADCSSVSGFAPANATVEVFSDLENEGRIFEGSVVNGPLLAVFSWSGFIHGPNVSVTYTTSSGETSEFGTRLNACLPATATTDAASGITTSAATLNGTVNPNSVNTSVTFQYGLTTSYGNTVTADPSPIIGKSNTAVSKGITGLSPNMTYHYRVVATNSAGTTYGTDLSFKTGSLLYLPLIMLF
jgi:hypothetical protein